MVIGLIAIILVMIWARTFFGSMRNYQKARTYLNEEQYVRAITFFDRSIHWYTPFNPYVRKSAENLWKIGEYAEKQGDIQLALMAYRTIRRGFYAARSFYTPGKKWIYECDLKIYEIMKLEQIQKETRDGSTVLGKYLSEGPKDASPNMFWTIILEIGFLGWIGVVICFIIYRLGFKGENKYSIASFLIWIAITIFFFALWIIGMVKA